MGGERGSEVVFPPAHFTHHLRDGGRGWGNWKTASSGSQALKIKTASFDILGFSDFTGAISWGTATPMDVVKSRIQADGVYLNKYRGVLDCISQSYRQEGFKVSCTQPPWVSSRLRVQGVRQDEGTGRAGAGGYQPVLD